mmetsp:Transcript_13766/g.24903  ORF Transcript_13766/g.24903 Transcript_13766/m.24903 type:complete len:474 (+) Transcript_13766:83-1504(+)
MRLARVLLPMAATAIIAPVCSGGKSLPKLSCPTYETAGNASEACSDLNGTLMTWGQYTNGSETKSALGTPARIGPYHCSKCDSGDDGFGYVGVLNESIPLEVSNYSASTHYPVGWGDSDIVGFCPEVSGSNETISCAALQQVCENYSAGWLIYAETFNSNVGIYMCSGCDTAPGVYGTHDDGNALTSWPMRMMYAIIATVLAVALYIDTRVFVQGKVPRNRELVGSEAGAVDLTTSSEAPPTADNGGGSERITMHERRSWYALYLMGYVDADGQIIVWYRAICFDRFKDLFCCMHRVDFGNFLSLLLVTLGVSVLLQDGHLPEYNCYFDATQSLEDTYQRQFVQDFYGQEGRPEKGGSYETPFDLGPEFWVAEGIVIAYQFSLDLLTDALSEAGYMKRGNFLLLMNLLSAIFCACTFIYGWEGLDGATLVAVWLVGLVAALFWVGPLFSTISRLLSKVLVAAGCLTLPKGTSI